MARVKAYKRNKPVYASELGLVCRQFERGTRKPCGRPAEFWIPGLGDACGLHLYGKQAIKYAARNSRVAAQDEKAA